MIIQQLHPFKAESDIIHQSLNFESISLISMYLNPLPWLVVLGIGIVMIIIIVTSNLVTGRGLAVRHSPTHLFCLPKSMIDIN